MAPQIGPKEAPTLVKNPSKFWATPVTASNIPTVTAITVERLRGTLGSMVAKLFEAINVQKHVGATEAAANRKKMAEANAPTWETAAEKSRLAGVRAPEVRPRCPATASTGRPPATTTATAIPIRPPQTTSPRLRLFIP